MLHHVTGDLFWAEDPDGLPIGLVVAPDDAPVSPKMAEVWRSASPRFRLLEWIATDAGREWLEHLDELGRSGED
jgi:hypothetical protein